MAAAWDRINGMVWGVIALHVFLYTAAVTCVIVPWLSYSVPGVLHLAALTCCTAASLGCMLVAVVTDPGGVPEGYVADTTEAAAQQVVEVKRKDGGARVCQKCGRGKPPRAHHCRICRRCVLRMDHHCNFLNNCVGHANFRAFLLFLLYGSTATCHAFSLLAGHAVYVAGAVAENRIIRTGVQAKAVTLTADAPMSGGASVAYSLLWAAFQVAATAVAMPVAGGLLFLLGWNLWLLVRNTTTIEYHEGVTAQVRALTSGAVAARHPYDLGPLANLLAVCGPPDPVSWCLPLDPAADGAGTAFPTIWDDRL